MARGLFDFRRQKKIKEKKSLMPENLINAMTLKDLVNLVEYLSQQKAN